MLRNFNPILIGTLCIEGKVHFGREFNPPPSSISPVHYLNDINNIGLIDRLTLVVHILNVDIENNAYTLHLQSIMAWITDLFHP